MIYITGDTHGVFKRFSTANFPEQKDMTREDLVIVVGDLGLIWDDSKEQAWWIQWFTERPFTLLFIDGNHENHDLLDNLPVEMWHGGKTHVIAGNIRHLMRGEIFELDGEKFFTFGGARSHDIQDGILDPKDPGFKMKERLLRHRHALYRVKGVSWWPGEMPSDEEYAKGIQNLEAAGWQVDYILTHCAPTSIQARMDGGRRRPDQLNEYLEEIHQKCQYRKWFFGHYHHERKVTDKDVCLYEQVVKLI